MYDVRQFVIRGARAVGSLAVATALVLAVLPVAPAYAPPAYSNAIYGHVNDALTVAPLGGIKVQAFTLSGGTYTPGPTTYTDASGDYGLALLDGTYRILFTDATPNPGQTYADSVFNGASHVEFGTPITLAGLTFAPASAGLQLASVIQVDVKRSGQWATPLKGMRATVVDTTDGANRPYTTNSNGSVRKGGVPTGAYRVTISDPAGKFGSVTLPGALLTHPLGTNDEWDVVGALPLLHYSANIVVSKPVGANSVKHGVKYSVSGTLSKAVTNPKTMNLNAYEWSPSALAWVYQKTGSLKITKSGTKSVYSGSIKFPHAGTWRLVAVFGGNSTYAQSGSNFKNVPVN